MIRKLIILTGVICLFLSCAKDEPEISGLATSEQEGNVTFVMSLKDQLKQDISHRPMKSIKAAADVKISNSFKFILTKLIGDDWVIARIETRTIQSGHAYSVSFTDGDNFDPFSLTLTPGKYRAVIFTGQNAVSWNSALDTGMVVGKASGEFAAPWACTYKTAADNNYTPKGEESLSEEIFSGMTEFEIEKSDNLHAYPVGRTISVPLYRRVGKFRVLLRDVVLNPEALNPIEWAKGYELYIFGRLQVQADSENTLCPGLDIWGEPQYRNTKVMNDIIYFTNTLATTDISTDGYSYYVSKFGRRNYNVNFFSEPGKDVKFRMTNIGVNFYSGAMEYEYYGSVDNLVLSHNKVNGIVFIPGYDWRDDSPGYRSMDLIYEAGSTTIPLNSNTVFDPYIEYTD